MTTNLYCWGALSWPLVEDDEKICHETSSAPIVYCCSYSASRRKGTNHGKRCLLGWTVYFRTIPPRDSGPWLRRPCKPSHIWDPRDKSSTYKQLLFYERTHDLESIGPFCSSVHLTRSVVLDWTLIVKSRIPFKLCNGLLIELADFCVKENLHKSYLFEFVQFLHPGVFDTAAILSTSVTKIRAEKSKVNKSISQNPNAVVEFLDNCIPPKSVIQDCRRCH
jgi:hypothetical protein